MDPEIQKFERLIFPTKYVPQEVHVGVKLGSITTSVFNHIVGIYSGF